MLRNPIRVALIDDHILFREGMKRALEAEGAMRVIAEATTVDEAINFCSSGLQCDLALIDFDLGRDEHSGNGLTVLRALRTNQSAMRVVIVTGALTREAIAEAEGALGASVFLKSEPLEDLFVLIRKTMSGEIVLSVAAQKIVDECEQSDLPKTITFSQRERMVLRLITEGLASKEIADCADLSETNIKAIIQRLFLKTGVRSRSQLVRYVFEFGVELH